MVEAIITLSLVVLELGVISYFVYRIEQMNKSVKKQSDHLHTIIKHFHELGDKMLKNQRRVSDLFEDIERNLSWLNSRAADIKIEIDEIKNDNAKNQEASWAKWMIGSKR